VKIFTGELIINGNNLFFFEIALSAQANPFVPKHISVALSVCLSSVTFIHSA